MSEKADEVERLLVSCCEKCGSRGSGHTKLVGTAPSLIIDHETGRITCHGCSEAGTLYWISGDQEDWRCNTDNTGYPHAPWEGRYEYIKVNQ
jgi:hypothetical protein